MLKVFAQGNGVKKERQRLNKNGIENVPAGNMRNVMRNRRAGGAGGRR